MILRVIMTPLIKNLKKKELKKLIKNKKKQLSRIEDKLYKIEIKNNIKTRKTIKKIYN